MIVRIVKMVFKEENIDDFSLFSSTIQHIIKKQTGCLHLEILQDINDPAIFFTFSKWETLDNLEAYRQSNFFREVWPKTKKWFAAKPEAWSLHNI